MRIFLLFFSAALLFSEGSHELFLRAEKHRSLGNFKEAILWYRESLASPGSGEEFWRSKYMLGTCYEKIGEWDSALSWYLEAFQCNPLCVDPLREITTHYRLEGKNDLAYFFAQHAKRISPQDPLLDAELVISSFYTPFKKEGLIAADSLIFSKKASAILKEQTYRNLVFYVAPFPGAQYREIKCALPRVNEDSEELYHPMNPSIHKCRDGYQVICRSVNYTQTGARNFHTNDPGGVFRTRNFLLHYDRELQLLGQSEIVEQLSRERVRSFNVEGMEDCRIFFYGGSLCFSCTTFDTNPGVPQISLCALAQDSREGISYVEKVLPLQGPHIERCEKNWLPLVLNEELYFIYSCGPFILNKPDLETGAWQIAFQYEAQQDFSSFRGSASPIEFDGGYLMLVHEVAFLSDFSRVYFHRFLQLDRELKVTHVSRPFVFTHCGVEFCSGMVLDHQEKNLILTIGIEDREALFCIIDLDSIRKSLECL